MGSPCPTLAMDRGILMENRIIGLPRMRQLKVHNSSCPIVSQFSGIIRRCFARYDPSLEDREPFPPERLKYRQTFADKLGSTECFLSAAH